MALERDFEKFTGGPVIASRDRMHVTLSDKSIIYFNQNTHRLLGNPAAASLYYSREKDTIAVEPASARLDQNFPIRPLQTGWRILAGPFLGHFGIRTDQTLRFVHPDIENGVLLLNLRDTVNVTPRRYTQRK